MSAQWDKLTNFVGASVYLHQDEDDAALVARCLAGELAAFEPLVNRYQRPLFNVALRLLGRHGDASDATQNAFVKAYTHLDSFDPRQRFFSWIYRILKNECLNVLRSTRTLEPLPSHLVAVGGPADALENAERHQALQKALMALSTEYREVIALRHFSELSYDEIGAALGIQAKTVKSRLFSARQRLGEILSDWRVR
jgi:RNA polymerase sigma-70 factor, ECF subfamily